MTTQPSYSGWILLLVGCSVDRHSADSGPFPVDAGARYEAGASEERPSDHLRDGGGDAGDADPDRMEDSDAGGSPHQDYGTPVPPPVPGSAAAHIDMVPGEAASCSLGTFSCNGKCLSSLAAGRGTSEAGCRVVNHTSLGRGALIGDHIYYRNEVEGYVAKVSLDGSGKQSILARAQSPEILGVHAGELFFLAEDDAHKKYLYAIPLAGGQARLAVNEVIDVHPLSLAAGALFYATYNPAIDGRQMVRRKLPGSEPEVLFGPSQHVAFVTDGAWMALSFSGTTAGSLIALDGSHERRSPPSGLKPVLAEGYLYWTRALDRTRVAFERLPLAGGPAEGLAVLQHAEDLTAIVGGHAYFIGGREDVGSLFRMPVTGGDLSRVAVVVGGTFRQYFIGPDRAIAWVSGGDGPVVELDLPPDR